MTAAAAATERLIVGTLVFDNDYRHPVVLAKEMATIDLLSEGSLRGRLGPVMKSDYASSGITMDRPGARVDKLIPGSHEDKGAEATWAALMTALTLRDLGAGHGQ